MIPRPPTSTLFPYTTLFRSDRRVRPTARRHRRAVRLVGDPESRLATELRAHGPGYSTTDRKSTRLNSSHVEISYAVFCLKKKKHNCTPARTNVTGRTSEPRS